MPECNEKQSTRTATGAACWLALNRVPGLGSAHVNSLLESFPEPCAILQATQAELARHGLSSTLIKSLREPDWPGVESDLAWLAGPQRHLLTIADRRYPPLLKETGNGPPVLFVQGNPDLLSQPQIAIVGSRNATPGGIETTRELAGGLAADGLIVTSGLALGVDGAAHRAAIDAHGLTIAACGTGLDRVYPAGHRELAHEIAEHGALVSEFPVGTPPRKENFPRRNRIISGLSLGTVVVEAGLQSGSLITARLAAEQGREVFAVPGSIHNPLARGCHRLIRQGAKLVESRSDILEELAPVAAALLDGPVGTAAHDGGDADRPAGAELDGDYTRLIECMGFDPARVDALVACTGLTPDVVSSMLLMLELQGHVAAMAGGRYMRLEKRNSLLEKRNPR